MKKLKIQPSSIFFITILLIFIGANLPVMAISQKDSNRRNELFQCYEGETLLPNYERNSNSPSARKSNSPGLLEETWTDLGEIFADAYHPEILQLANGTYIMAYNGDKYSSVNITLSDDLLNWGPPIEIATSPNPWEHSMVQLPNGSVLLAYADDPGWDIYTSVSTNLGTWSTPSLALTDEGRAPSMILDKSGVLRMVTINDDGEGHHTPFIASSVDNGNTWTPATRLLSTPTAHDYAVGLLQLQNSSYAIIFGSDRSGSWRFYLTQSTNFQAWSEPFELPFAIGGYFHAAHQLRDGQIIFFYVNASGGIYSARTTDFQAWTPPVLVTPTDANGPVMQSDSKRVIELANGSLRFFAARIINSDQPIGINCFAYDPPYEVWDGDWVITNDTVIENKKIILSGKLLVQNNGNLTLRNTTLKMNCHSDGQYRISIFEGGNLTIEENSTVTAADPANAWFLMAHSGSALSLKDSFFSYAGWEWGSFPEEGAQSGLWIRTNNAIIDNCTIQGNYIGIYLNYAQNALISRTTIENSTMHGIVLELSHKSIISGNNLAYGTCGVYSLGASETTIENCIITDFQSGLHFLKCLDEDVITNNTLRNLDSRGIFLDRSEGCLIFGNNITNAEVGIELELSTRYCQIWGNFLASRFSNGWDESAFGAIGNQWDNNTHGNWWDDYYGPDWDHDGIGDTFYLIPPKYQYDHFPLVNLLDEDSPHVDSPADVAYELGTTGRNITWQPTDANPCWHNITRDGMLVADGSWLGENLSIAVSGLQVGTYHYTLTVYDRVGNWTNDTVRVRVFHPDSILPTIDHPADVSYSEGTANQTITWIASDVNPFWYNITRNGTIIAGGPWSNGSITLDVSGLLEGTYVYQLAIWDLANNIVVDEVNVTVTPAHSEETSAHGFGPLVTVIGLLATIILFRRRLRFSKA